MAYELSYEEIEQIEEAFREFDTDGDGKIASTQLGDIMERLGFYSSENELDQLTSWLRNPNFFELHELLNILSHRINCTYNDPFVEAFQSFDDEGDGRISKEVLKNILTHDGYPTTKEKLDEILALAEADEEGKIDYYEFLNNLMCDCFE